MIHIQINLAINSLSPSHYFFAHKHELHLMIVNSWFYLHFTYIYHIYFIYQLRRPDADILTNKQTNTHTQSCVQHSKALNKIENENQMKLPRLI